MVLEICLCFLYNQAWKGGIKQMGKNKRSIWSTIILVATIISLALLIAGVITLALTVPVVSTSAKEAAINEGVSEADASAVALIAMVTVIVVFVIQSIFDILKIIGGFMFSLKGRWGIFCIIVSLIAFISAVAGLITDINEHSGATSIILDSLTLAVDALLMVACFKHRQENKR
mgnify:CR=1 FL=1